MLGYLPQSAAESLTPREIGIAYEGLCPEVHWLVSVLLAKEIDEHRYAHTLLDTPALALRAMATNVGRTLPEFDHTPEGYKRVGKTRAIDSSDLFSITDGPTAADNGKRFITYMKRAA